MTKAVARAWHDVVHVHACGLLTAKDRDIWKYTAKNGFAVIDGDFAAMRLRARSGPAVVWLRLGNVSNNALIEALASALPEIVWAIEAGEAVMEVR